MEPHNDILSKGQDASLSQNLEDAENDLLNLDRDEDAFKNAGQAAPIGGYDSQMKYGLFDCFSIAQLNWKLFLGSWCCPCFTYTGLLQFLWQDKVKLYGGIFTGSTTIAILVALFGKKDVYVQSSYSREPIYEGTEYSFFAKFILLAYGFLSSYLLMELRKRIKESKNMASNTHEDKAMDFAVSCLCQPCYLCQAGAEYDVDPFDYKTNYQQFMP